MRTFYTPARFFVLALFVLVLGTTLTYAQTQFSYTDFSSTAGLHLNGSAAAVNNGSANVLRITPASLFQDGSFYYATPMSLSSPFSTQFTFQFPQVSPNGAGSADGIAFIIQNSPATDAALGFSGGGIGYGDDDLNFFPSLGIPKSLAIEIDTYRNVWDPATPHVAAMSCLTGYNSSHHGGKCANGTKAGSDPTLAINSALATNVLDGKQHTLIVKYQLPCPGCQNVTVTLDGNPVLQFAFDLATLGLDANDDAYLGFTASTGGGFEDHDILSWSFSPDTIVLPVVPTAPTSFSFAPTLTHTVDFSLAAGNSNLTYPNNDPNTIQIQSTNTIIDPATWPQYVTGGPLATSILLPLAEDNPSGSGADGSLFVDLCFDPTLTGNAAIPLDTNCPYASSGTSFLLGIQIAAELNTNPPFNNPTNTGITTALAHYEPNSTGTTSWAPSPINGTANPACSLTTGTSNSNAPQTCDVLDIQQSFYGDPTSSGKTKSKGAFAMLYNVAMPLSNVTVNGTSVNTPPTNNNGFSSALWFNSPLSLGFTVNPACPLSLPAWPCTLQTPANFNYFSPAPIAGETFQVTDLSGNLVYPAQGNPAPAQAVPPSNFNTLTVQPITFPGSSNQISLPDGQYFLQWSAVDNVGILEQNVQFVSSGTCPNPAGGTFPPPCYQTTLFQAQLNVDSTLPTIGAITISPAPVFGQPSAATFACTDPAGPNNAPASGINPTNGCVGGPNSQPSGVSGNVDTSSAGPKTFTVTASDLAGNVATGSLPYTVSQASASVTFSNLTQTYTGSALTPTVTTVPSALSNTVTGAPQTNAGSYPVTATITDPNYTGTASGTFVISPAAATVTLSSLAQTYTGGPLAATATTNPASLAVSFIYNGSPTPPTNVGSYAVVATITNPNYTGTASGTLVISPAAASVTLSNMSQSYTGGALSPAVTTNPSGLSYTLGGAPQTNVGNYTVVATITNSNYTGSASGTFIISPAAAIVTLGNLTQAYTGSPLSPTVTTTPAGLTYTLTGAPDTAAGSYPVMAKVTNPNYSGSATGTFVITRPAATVSPSSINFGTIKSGTSASQTVTLTNTGTATMTIHSGVLLNGSTHDFSAVNHCGSTLGAGSYCTIIVTYHADKDDGNGTSATLVITDNAPGSPQSVPITGKSK
jgi:MBG domain/Legume lectin domain/Abnormal spindle-like microcephaly-assoc'd, ASPM-SPD-2-Hydin